MTKLKTPVARSGTPRKCSLRILLELLHAGLESSKFCLQSPELVNPFRQMMKVSLDSFGFLGLTGRTAQMNRISFH